MSHFNDATGEYEGGLKLAEDEIQHCDGCDETGSVYDDWKRIDGKMFCEECYRDLPWCGDGEHKFIGEPLAVEGLDGFVFCGEGHAKFAREEWV